MTDQTTPPTTPAADATPPAPPAAATTQAAPAQTTPAAAKPAPGTGTYRAFELEVHGLLPHVKTYRLTEIRMCPPLVNGDVVIVPDEDLRRILDAYPNLRILPAPFSRATTEPKYAVKSAKALGTPAGPGALGGGDGKGAASTTDGKEKQQETPANKTMAGKTKTK